MLIHVRYGIGYGTHSDEIEVEDDLTEDEINHEVEQFVTERLDWGWHREGE